MDDAVYFASNRISNSKLSTLKRSPELFKLQFIDQTLLDISSDAMVLGKLVHCLALEPNEVAKRFYIADKFDRRTKEGKANHEKQVEESKGKTLITLEGYESAAAMANAVLTHNEFAKLSPIPCETEKAIEFTWNGVPCKSKLDRVYARGRLVIDIKTTSDPSPAEFAKSVAKFGYHRQQAFYSEAVQQCYGVEPRFLFFAVGTDFPFLCGCYELKPDAVRDGRREIECLLAEYTYRTDANDWTSSFRKDVNPLSLPKWYSNDN
jgi:exodeoxyribonuclease VIII